MVQLYARSGTETFVNTVTQEWQGHPKITRLSTGGYVVLWTDGSGIGGDTSSYAVKGQIFDSAGGKVGGEFLVNTATSGAQMIDSVATTSNGGFVAVYLTENQAIKAQIFDSSGARTGGELLVTVPLPNPGERNSNASATVLANGTIIVAWDRWDPYSGPNNGDHIFARAFSATGTALGGEFRLDSSGAPSVTPSVTALASGGWVATWVSYTGAVGNVVGQVFAANGAKVGGEFAVDSSAGAPVVTALSGGGFVVGWEDSDGGFDDGSYGGIKAQIFDDSGARLGSEFPVNTITRGNQGYFGIDDLPGGGFVVTWTDESRLEGDSESTGIMAQVFDSAGGKVGTQFLVNTITQGPQDLPAVAALASGAFAVAWQSAPGYFQYTDIKTQLFTPHAGTATDIALSTASVSETSIGNYAVATLSDNGGVNSAKTYTLLADSTGGGFRIAGNRLVAADNSRLDHETAPTASLTVRVTDANGNSFDEVLNIAVADAAIEDRYMAEAEFAAGTGNVVYGKASAIGALAGGGFVMTWVGNGDEALYVGAGAIRGQLFDAAGAKVGTEFLVNTTVSGAQQDPAAAGLQGGGFVVVWDDYSELGGDTSYIGIKGQRFDSSGAKVGGEFQVNTLTQNGQADASVAGLASGGFVVTWTNSDDGVSDISVQLFDAAGAKIGGERVVNSASGFNAGNHWHPAVAALPNGGFVVTWTHSQVGQIMAQIFDSAGNKVGTDFLVASDFYYGQDNPTVAALASGGFVIGWSDQNPQGGDTSFTGVKAQIFDSAGAKVGDRLQVNTAIEGDQILPTVSGLPWGGFVVSWQDDVGSGDDPNTAVRAQIYDALGGRIGGNFVVNAGTDDGQAAPVSALLSSGGFAVGWQEAYSEDGLTRNRFEGRVFSLTQADNSGDDILTGDANANLLDGGAGNDQIYGLGGDDDLRGGTGNDRLHVTGTGLAAAAGGADFDYLEVNYGDSVAAITMTIPTADPNGGLTGSIGDGGIRRVDYSGIEVFNIATGSGNDIVRGGGDTGAGSFGSNSYSLGAGDDLFHYRGGTDTVDAGTGVDGFSGDLSALGVGIQWSLIPVLFPGLEVTFANFEYFQLLTTGGGQDLILTSNVNRDDTLILGGNSDRVTFYDGHDFVNGGAAGAGATDSGTDMLVLNYIQATAGVHNLGALASNAAGYSGQYGDDSTRLVTFEAIDQFVISTGSGADSITTGGGDDQVRTGGGNDVLDTGGGKDLLDGGAGDDIMTGGAGDDFYWVSSHADVVNENPGGGTDEVHTALAVYSLVALPNVEDLSASSDLFLARDFRGNSANNVVKGGEGSDVLRLYDGGDDTVFGGAGSDNIFFIGALTAADVVIGGSGTDTLVLQGPYGSLTLTGNVTEIENVSLLGGNNTNFGEPGTNRYDYSITTSDANFAAGVQARINGAALLEGEDFTFNGSAETDAKFVVYGGKGTDTLTGGLGNDIFFYAEERFASGDTVNGGAGYDGMFLRGNYTIDFNAPGYTGLFTNIENLTLTSATDERYARGGGTEFDYNLILSNAIVKPGETLTVSGALLMATETMVLDASQETDGLLRLFGGRANDTLKGGANADLIHGNMGGDILSGGGGADVFRYDSTAESSFSSTDQITDFTPGTDKVDLSRIDADTLAAGDQAFSWIGSNAFTGSAGQLRASAFMGNAWILEGDTDGNGQPDLFLVLALQGPTPLGAGDFLL